MYRLCVCVCLYSYRVFIQMEFCDYHDRHYLYIPTAAPATAMVTSTFLFDRRQGRKTRVRQKCERPENNIQKKIYMFTRTTVIFLSRLHIYI